jgi:hypothetical protein
MAASSSICKEEKSFGSTDDDDDDKMKDTKKSIPTSTAATPTTTSTKSHTSNIPFYGDLVCAVAFTVVTPIDGWKAAMTCQQELHDDTDTTTTSDDAVCTERIFGLCQTAILSVTFCTLYGGLNWISYLHHSKKYSFFAFLSGLWLCAFNNLQQWPYAGECVMYVLFSMFLVSLRFGQ